MRCDVARRIREAREVNTALQLTQRAVNANAPRGKRGAYPNTDRRREYMRKKMADRRAKGLA